MNQMNEILTELNPNLFSDIKFSFRTIFKLDTESDNFINLVKKYPKIENACYIVNSNTNQPNGSIFLGTKGDILFEADFFANLLPVKELDFNIEIPNLTKNHPLGEILNSEFSF